jgi:hypothetical protein
MAATAAGFDASHVSPQDAIVTFRSLRRRFAEAFDQAEDAGDVTRLRDGASLSPLQHAASTASALQAIGIAVERVNVAENPEISLPPVVPAGPGGGSATRATAGGESTPPAVLAHLGDIAGSVADGMAEMHGDDWTRTGRTPEGEVTALDIARLGVRIGIDHLRAAQEAIRAGSR